MAHGFHVFLLQSSDVTETDLLKNRWMVGDGSVRPVWDVIRVWWRGIRFFFRISSFLLLSFVPLRERSPVECDSANEPITVEIFPTLQNLLNCLVSQQFYSTFRQYGMQNLNFVEEGFDVCPFPLAYPPKIFCAIEPSENSFNFARTRCGGTFMVIMMTLLRLVPFVKQCRSKLSWLTTSTPALFSPRIERRAYSVKLHCVLRTFFLWSSGQMPRSSCLRSQLRLPVGVLGLEFQQNVSRF